MSSSVNMQDVGSKCTCHVSCILYMYIFVLYTRVSIYMYIVHVYTVHTCPYTCIHCLYSECRSAIAECFLPLLKTIYEAPESSPLHKIDISNLTLFILKLSAPIDEEVSK